MTATTSSISQRKPSSFSTERKKGGSYVLTAGAVTALSAVTTATTVREVLDILSEVVRDSHPVSADGIGAASHVDA